MPASASREKSPVEQFSLDIDVFTSNIRSAQARSCRWPVRDDRRTSQVGLGICAPTLQVPTVPRRISPPDVLALLRMGRLAALQKPGGGVRGIVCGDLVRRLVARSIAQQISSAVEEATSPFQYALTTKASGECVAHAIQSLTDLDSRATVLSIDGIGAFDMISRAAMLDGLQQVRGGDTCASFRAPVFTPTPPSISGPTTAATPM